MEVDNIYLKFELEKKREYQNGDKVGIVKVMLGNESVYEDNVYIGEEKEKKKFNILEWLKSLW